MKLCAVFVAILLLGNIVCHHACKYNVGREICLRSYWVFCGWKSNGSRSDVWSQKIFKRLMSTFSRFYTNDSYLYDSTELLPNDKLG